MKEIIREHKEYFKMNQPMFQQVYRVPMIHTVIQPLLSITFMLMVLSPSIMMKRSGIGNPINRKATIRRPLVSTKLKANFTSYVVKLPAFPGRQNSLFYTTLEKQGCID